MKNIFNKITIWKEKRREQGRRVIERIYCAGIKEANRIADQDISGIKIYEKYFIINDEMYNLDRLHGISKSYDEDKEKYRIHFDYGGFLDSFSLLYEYELARDKVYSYLLDNLCKKNF